MELLASWNGRKGERVVETGSEIYHGNIPECGHEPHWHFFNLLFFNIVLFLDEINYDKKQIAENGQCRHRG